MGKVTVTDREFFNLELISDHISQAVQTETRKLRHKKKIDLEGNTRLLGLQDIPTLLLKRSVNDILIKNFICSNKKTAK